MKQAIAKAIRNALLAWSLIAMAFMYAVANAPTAAPSPEVERPMAVGSPEELASRMQCWGEGETPLAKWPGHVVYRYNGDWKIGGKAKADEALNNVFGNTDTGIVIHKFCI